jgi:hypothetical protein
MASHRAKRSKRTSPIILAGDPIFLANQPQTNEQLVYGLHGRHFSAYYQLFPKGYILVYRFEEISPNSLATIKNIWRFLQIGSGFSPAELHNEPQKVDYRLRSLRSITLISQ